MKKRLKRAALGILLLPVCYGVLFSLLGIAPGFKQVPEGSFYFGAGFLAYLIFQWVFFKPMRTYVLGHEWTHVVAAWMSGSKVSHIKVSKEGGSVTVSKPNIWVALAPYIVPFYSLLVMGLYFGVGLFYPVSQYWNLFLGILGATLSFHAALTAYALRQGQSDLKAAGKFLSAIFIFLGNSLALVFVLSILFPETVSWRAFWRGTQTHTIDLCRRIGEGGSYLWAHHHEYLNGHFNK